MAAEASLLNGPLRAGRTGCFPSMPRRAFPPLPRKGACWRAAERAVEKLEVRLDELAQEAEGAASDYLRLQEIYRERELAEDELARRYAEWERLAAELEDAKGS